MIFAKRPLGLFLRLSLALSLTALPGETHAQSQPQAQAATRVEQAVPSGHVVRTVAERRFDAASGLRASTVFAMAQDQTGVPWLATDDGVFSYAGAQWRREAMPPEFERQQVRALLHAADGGRWMGTRSGLVYRAPDGRFVVYREADGLAGGTVFSLIESDAIDGRVQVLAGTSRGVSRFNGSGFESVPLPPDLNALALMLQEARAVDGSSELWVASARGQVARLHRGTWRVFSAADGLTTESAEHLASARGDSGSTVYVAGRGGVFVLRRSAEGERFERVPGAPDNAYRVEAVPTTDARSHAVWVGTSDGRVLQWDGATWHTVSTRLSDSHGTITMLQHLAGHGGGSAVYAAARGAYLVRLSQGVAAGVSVFPDRGSPYVNAVVAERGADGRDVLWVATQDSGLVRLGAMGDVRRFGFEPGSSRGAVTDLLRVSVSPPGPVIPGAEAPRTTLALANGVPWRFDGAGFAPMLSGLNGTRVHQVRRLPDVDGVEALLAATDDGVFRWSGSRWERAPVDVRGPVTSLASGVERGARVLYVGGVHTITTLGRGVSRVDTLPALSASLGIGSVRRVCTSGASTSGYAFAFDTERGVFWRRLDEREPWRALPLRLRRVLTSLGATDLVCLDNGRLAVGTFAGLALFDVSAASVDAWRILSQVADADGLPANAISAVATSGHPELLWVGTGFGLGVVDVARAAQLSPARLALRVTVQGAREVRDGDVLMPTDNDLHVEPSLLTYHREELTRFRVQLSEGELTSPRVAVDSLGGEWLDVPDRYYHDLPPGRYTLTVWAYDWAGREYGPILRHFSMQVPAYESPAALVTYGALIALILTGAYQWRMATLRSSTQRLLERERQADAERAWFQEQVREAQKLESLGTLAGGVAHDFNNLLGVIRGNAELARTALRKGRSNADHLGAILDASDRARDIVRQILTFSRRSTPTREYVNLSRLVLDLQPLLRRMVPRTVQLVTTGAEHAHLVQGDPTQLQQLLLNLVSNAEYALRQKVTGTITLVLSTRTVAEGQPAPTGTVVVLQVRDTGDGMSEEVRQRIFEPFFTTKPTGEGTGLGMAVVHGIVVSHGGRAEVFSTPGAGSTFELTFPAANIEGLFDDDLDPDLVVDFDDESPSDASAPMSRELVVSGEFDVPVTDDGSDDHDDAVLETSPFAGTSVVVVDDEPGVAAVVERALQHAGHVVHVFTAPEAALAFIRDQPFAVDLVITDQTMPGMTGDMLTEQIHALRAELPVLILTGFSHRLSAERVAAVGVMAVLDKPVALATLRRAVNAALAGSS
ncbi:ATP-binding protein [Gemmatimonas sp. UBA7669]|uniref:ATP-binding protein n=1 Tax=Gemmatimonas sp. UBA7669 TaxID=1946568 RepID=UPI0025C4B69D|nr:ATP-binding protein [Gemmatimonas sp. UBA7669]